MSPKRRNKTNCAFGKAGHPDLLERYRHFTGTLSEFKHQTISLHRLQFCWSLKVEQDKRKFTLLYWHCCLLIWLVCHQNLQSSIKVIFLPVSKTSYLSSWPRCNLKVASTIRHKAQREKRGWSGEEKHLKNSQLNNVQIASHILKEILFLVKPAISHTQRKCCKLTSHWQGPTFSLHFVVCNSDVLQDLNLCKDLHTEQWQNGEIRKKIMTSNKNYHWG